MAKYSFEFKKKVVLAYLNGEGGYGYLAKIYGIPAPRRVEEWVHNYNAYGDEGLMRSRKNEIYSFEKKLSIVELYLTSELSYQDIALKEGIRNPAMIVKWVNDFRIVGPDALRAKKKGRMSIKKLYLDPFMDMCNGEILSYNISKQPSANGVMTALKEAIDITSDCPYRRTFHSDRGWAYQMKSYTYELKEHRIFQSMSRKGNCYDNSIMENFFGILKQEMYYGVVYYSYEDLKEAIEKYIIYYNEQRIKQKLGWMSPVEYRLSLLVA